MTTYNARQAQRYHDALLDECKTLLGSYAKPEDVPYRDTTQDRAIAAGLLRNKTLYECDGRGCTMWTDKPVYDPFELRWLGPGLARTWHSTHCMAKSAHLEHEEAQQRQTAAVA